MRVSSFELIQAIRGPIMMITLGVLVVLDYFEGVSFSHRTWPVLLIVFGLLKLFERAGRPPVPPVPPVYPGTPASPNAGGHTA